MSAYTIALELTILLAFWLWLGVWQRARGTPGRETFAAVIAAAIVWCVGEILHHNEQAPEIVADRIRYLAILALPPLWLGLAAHATRLDLARRVPWFPVVLMVPLAAPYALMYSSDWNELFVLTVPGGPDRYGPLWPISIGYCYLLIGAASGLFLVAGLRTVSSGGWIRGLAMGLAPIVPAAANAVHVSRGLIEPYDPTPVLFGFALVALRSGIYHGSLLQALPVSQHDLIEQLPLGVVLTDRTGVVIDMNPAAELRLAVPEAIAIGRNLEAVLGHADDDVPVHATPIFSNGREVGQLVLIDPPFKEEPPESVEAGAAAFREAAAGLESLALEDDDELKPPASAD